MIHSTDYMDRDADYAFVNTEVSDTDLVVNAYVGPDNEVFQLPRIVSRTISPVIDNIARKALEEKTQIGTVNADAVVTPTIYLRETNPDVFRVLSSWICTLGASNKTSDHIHSVLFDTGCSTCSSPCGKILFKRSGVLCTSAVCLQHDPTKAIEMIQLTDRFQIYRLKYEVIRALLLYSGVQPIVAKEGENAKLPQSISWTRVIPAWKPKQIQFCRLTMTPKFHGRGVEKLTGEEYEISGFRKGELEPAEGRYERQMTVLGGFEVFFDFWSANASSNSSYMGKLAKMMNGGH